MSMEIVGYSDDNHNNEKYLNEELTQRNRLKYQHRNSFSSDFQHQFQIPALNLLSPGPPCIWAMSNIYKSARVIMD